MEYLRHRYIETRYIPEGKEWPPNQPKYYVNLAVIHYQGSRTQEEVIFSIQHLKLTDVATESKLSFSRNISQQPKISNELQVTHHIVDLFAPDPHEHQTEVNAKSDNIPRSILIEGAPGIGKTVLLKEIAYRWANGTILDNARIVFLIYLRDSRFQSITTLNELLQYFDCLEEREILAVAKKMKQSNGEGVVFLIDGLDEYPGALQNTLLARLIDRKILSKCVYVITSRSFASITLHNKVERRIEILGFGNEERDEYISKSFNSSPIKRQELEIYLKQHPMLDSLVYIPFHLSVLLFLFQQGNLPETLTEMNESFILHTVYRHMEKHNLPTSCIVKLDSFPKPVYGIVYRLSKLAFEGLQKNQLVFTFDEVKQMCPEVDTTPGALNGFGLLQAVQHYPTKGAGTTVSFNFLHLTMQEFLAAWYISHCSVKQQIQLLKQSFMHGEFQNEVDNSIARMWQMYIGIVGVNSDAWTKFASDCNFSLNIFDDPLRYLYYFQCLLEGKCEDVHPVSSVFEGHTIQFPYDKLLPYHIALLCLFLSKSSEQWRYYDLYGNAIGDVGAKILIRFLLANENILMHIKVFKLSSNCLTSLSATAVSNIIMKGAIVKLDLSFNDLGGSGTAEISQALKVNSSIKSLSLLLNNIGVDGAKSLAIALHHNCTLESLLIGNNKIMDDGVIAISECFKIIVGKNANLNCIKSLDLSANSLTSHSKTAISTIIQEGALKSLDLSYNKLGESGAYEISKVVQLNLTLKRLFLSSNDIGVSGVLSIAVALCHNQMLEHLDISNNKILDDGAMAIAECLKTNRTLKSLDMTHNNITEIGTIEIVEVLKFNTVFKTLMINRKYVDMLKSYTEQTLYNETDNRYFHIEVQSQPTHHCYQDVSLVRIWTDDHRDKYVV